MKSPLQPALFMVYFWSAVFLLYYFGPIYLTPALGMKGFFFILMHIVLFAFASIFLSRFRIFGKNNTHSTSALTTLNTQSTLILVALLIGICGGILSLYSKLSLLNHINIASITKLRAMRAQNLLHGGVLQYTYLSALAFLIYPASYVGIVSAILTYERLSILVKTLLFINIFVILFVSVGLGGRSQLFVLFMFIGIACYVRHLLGKSWMPKSFLLRAAGLFLVLSFMVYSSLMWTIRAQDVGYDTERMLQHASTVWGAHPKNYLVALGEKLHNHSLVQTISSTTFYFVQSISTVEKLMDTNNNIQPLYGAYHIDIIAAILRTIPNGMTFLQERNKDLMDAKVYGYFAGAWAGLYIDFGSFSFVLALIWGYFAGRAWRQFKQEPNATTSLLYIFWFFSIFISFVSPPLGFSNSLFTFIWFIIFISANAVWDMMKNTIGNRLIANNA